MTKVLIGLTGHFGAGKDSVARILCDEYGYTRRALADALKMEVWLKSVRQLGHYSGHGHSLDWPAWLTYINEHKHEAPDSPSGWPRRLLQSWAQMRRDLCGTDYWLKQVELVPGVVISDVRYTNERDAVKQAGGVLWRVRRSGYDGDGHASEVEIDTMDVDRTIHNTGSLDDLRVKVRLALDGAHETAEGRTCGY